MNRLFRRGAALLAASAVLVMSAPALAQSSQLPSVRGANGPLDTAPVAQILPNGGSPCVLGASGCPGLPTADPNNASYTSATQLTVSGAAVPSTRGVAADCTAAGSATLTMSGGGSLTWSVSVGHQNQPYSITGVSASTATCTFYGLK